MDHDLFRITVQPTKPYVNRELREVWHLLLLNSCPTLVLLSVVTQTLSFFVTGL